MANAFFPQFTLAMFPDAFLPELLDDLLPVGSRCRFVAREKLAGGCISDAERLTIEHPDDRDGSSRRVLFWKKNNVGFLENFRCEANGLQNLRDAGIIRTPAVLGLGVSGGQSHLLLEFIERGRSGIDYQRFGDSLAQHHLATAGDSIGWPTDNFLGSTVQPNRWTSDTGSWPDFFASRRIEHQTRMASDAGLLDTTLKKDLGDIIRGMDQWLAGREDLSSLLHGDLWSGNFWSDPDGAPVWIDPAVYRGCREAEFGMIELFGGCPGVFHEAYLARWPLPDGWRRRVDIYVLYHLLNHLNLFGTSYLQSCRARTAAILRST
ncbi:fructosamine kinase family protein [Aporhodopirellula aestuarii]|uniref:Fructosamine kinase family protein n=1 Tax=Aporhodopirellula aestuarii TaxID=2950107 RepID=A0ABT0U6R5_9BACT|nr:fructosamine kinase family protein [Aporhodopirellula aestuarii]MCM2372026.1 fructosamine kinase family protein [Aporhodopirellula aestuarii]